MIYSSAHEETSARLTKKGFIDLVFVARARAPGAAAPFSPSSLADLSASLLMELWKLNIGRGFVRYYQVFSRENSAAPSYRSAPAKLRYNIRDPVTLINLD